MVYAITYILIHKNLITMKALFTFLVIFLSVCFCNNVIAQLGGKIVKQPPKIKSVLKATNSAKARVKIHANSNTVVGKSKTQPKYNKKNKKKVDLKDEKEIEATAKKEKKSK